MKNDIGKWFNSDFCRIYYEGKRSHEVTLIVKNLASKLAMEEGDHVLDLCCGIGRHSIAFRSLGLNVLGIDKSRNNITYANKSATSGLSFLCLDVKNFKSKENFKYIFNLFTSFGYSSEANYNLLGVVASNLSDDGVFVLDYWNCDNLKYDKLKFGHSLLEKQVHIGNNLFETFRTIQDGYYHKKIIVNGAHTFYERSMLLDLDAIKEMLLSVDLEIKSTHGDYDLNPYNREQSERIIIIAQKFGM